MGLPAHPCQHYSQRIFQKNPIYLENRDAMVDLDQGRSCSSCPHPCPRRDTGQTEEGTVSSRAVVVGLEWKKYQVGGKHSSAFREVLASRIHNEGEVQGDLKGR